MNIVHRGDRSSASSVLQEAIVRPLATKLRAVKKIDSSESPCLHAPYSVRRKCKIQERCIQSIYIYDIIPKKHLRSKDNNPSNKKKHVYYFAGGSWQSPPDAGHWKFLLGVAERMRYPSMISLVSVPLAPKAPVHITFPRLLKLFQYLSTQPEFVEEDVCFAGDSSGGNIALALTMQFLESHKDASPQAPSNLVLICPTVDVRHEHPDLEHKGEDDPIESLKFIEETADAWAQGVNKDDSRVSPTLGAIDVLAKHHVNVYGIVAGRDVLGVEALEFIDKCHAHGVKGRVLVWDKQMHNFAMTAPYRVVEGLLAMDWVAHAMEQGGKEGGPETDEVFDAIEKKSAHTWTGCRSHNLATVEEILAEAKADS